MGTLTTLRLAVSGLTAAACAAWLLLGHAGAAGLAPRGGADWPGEGLVRLEIRDVVPLPEVNTHAVVLASPSGELLVPLFVDAETALSVALRLAHRRPPGPLAPELLSGVLEKVGGRITALRVDGLERNAYTGRVRVQQGSRVFELPVRPTDALALALESDAAVYASRKLVDESGITREQIEKLRESLPRAPAPTPHRQQDGDHAL